MKNNTIKLKNITPLTLFLFNQKNYIRVSDKWIVEGAFKANAFCIESLEYVYIYEEADVIVCT